MCLGLLVAVGRGSAGKASSSRRAGAARFGRLGTSGLGGTYQGPAGKSWCCFLGAGRLHKVRPGRRCGARSACPSRLGLSWRVQSGQARWYPDWFGECGFARSGAQGRHGSVNVGVGGHDWLFPGPSCRTRQVRSWQAGLRSVRDRRHGAVSRAGSALHGMENSGKASSV